MPVFPIDQLANTTTAGDQADSDVAVLSDGRFVIVWRDDSQISNSTLLSDVRAQIFNADGSKSGSEFIVESNSTGRQQGPSVSALGAGFVAAFGSSASSADRHIMARLFDGNGTPLVNGVTGNTDEFEALSFPTSGGVGPGSLLTSITTMIDGHFVVSNRGELNESILGHVFDNAGNPLSSQFTIKTAAGLSYYGDGSVHALAGGGFVVTNTTKGNISQVYEQVYDPLGHEIGSRAVATTNRTNTIINAISFGLADGGFVVVWASATGLFGALCDANGMPVDTDATDANGVFQIAPNNNGGNNMSIAAAPNGGFLLTWASGGIHGQMFDANAAPVGASFVVNANSGGNVRDIEAAALADGRVVVTWTDDNHIGGDNSGSAIKFQIVDLNAPAFSVHGDILFQHTDGTPMIWLMDGVNVGVFGAPLANPGPAWHAIDLGDFNRDEQPDILWQNDSGAAAVWLMNGANILSFGPALPNPGPTWHTKDAADFNGDGKADILWQNDSGVAAVWLMDGVNVAGMGGPINPGSASWHADIAGDFNGDGKADILWQNDNGMIGVWLMDGVNVKGIGNGINPPSASWRAKAAGDFNGDGKDDILLQNDDGTPAIWLMDSTVPNITGTLINPGAGWHVKDAVDYDNDGKADIVWQHDNGTPAVWLMDGLNILEIGPALTNPGADWHVV